MSVTVFRLADAQTSEYKYIGITESLETGLSRQAKLYPWMLSAKWKIHYLVAGTMRDAKKIAKDLIRLYTPIFNNQAPPAGDPEGSGEEARKIREWEQSLPWEFFGEADFAQAGQPEQASGRLRLGSARTNILILAAMSQGMAGREVCLSICGNQNQFGKVVCQMKKKREGEIVFGKARHMLHILRAGCEAVEALVPGTLQALEANSMSMGHIQRKNDVSTALYMLQLAGAQVIPVRKPAIKEEGEGRGTLPYPEEGELIAYAPYEVKMAGQEGLRGSRMAALAVTSDFVYVIYHMGDRNLKFFAAVERKTDAVLQVLAGSRRLRTVLLGKTQMLDRILKNDKAKKKMEKGSKSADLITSDMNMWFVPTDDFLSAAVYLQLLVF